MKIGTKFFQKEFINEESKKAYIMAFKWITKHIVGKGDLDDTYYKMNKVLNEDQTTTIKIELYANIDDKDFDEHFCTVCKEFHTKFYINEHYDCNCCNKAAYSKQAKEKLRIKRNYRRGLLNKIELELEEE